jgi:polysaccharide biosynthesis transport protein
MSITQFGRILRSWWWLILATTICCAVGGAAVIALVPARWQSDAHVYLNLLKPDAVTGEIIAGPATRAYVATQTELISDYSVVGPTVDRLGWESEPALIQAYQNRPASDTRDFRRWIAQLIMDRTKATVLDGSNILEISYTGSNAETATAVSEALMQSYLDVSLAFRRAEANRSAQWYSEQAAKAKAALITAQAAEVNFERANGVVLQDDKTDLDSARLAAMSAQANSATTSGDPGGSADVQLAQLDATIKQEAAVLGPNHPELRQLQAKRAALARLIAQERAPLEANSTGKSRVDSQKALVISERNKIASLQNLQNEVEFLQDQYTKTAGREAEFRQQAAVADSGLSPLGHASIPESPSFPNKPLIIGGSVGLGLLLGSLISLLIELLNRRVRGPEDLQSSLRLPVLAILSIH